MSLRNVLEEHDIKNNEGARVLILKPLIAGFGFFLIGLFISTLVLIYELRKKYPSISIFKTIKIMLNKKKLKKKKQYKHRSNLIAKKI